MADFAKSNSRRNRSKRILGHTPSGRIAQARAAHHAGGHSDEPKSLSTQVASYWLWTSRPVAYGNCRGRTSHWPEPSGKRHPCIAFRATGWRRRSLDPHHPPTDVPRHLAAVRGYSGRTCRGEKQKRIGADNVNPPKKVFQSKGAYRLRRAEWARIRRRPGRRAPAYAGPDLFRGHDLRPAGGLGQARPSARGRGKTFTHSNTDRHWPMSKMRLLVLSRACGSLERTEDVFDIYTIIFLAFAIVIFLKLRRVLGQRTGRKRPRHDTYSARDAGRGTTVTTTKQSNCLRKRRLSRLRSLRRSGGKA